MLFLECVSVHFEKSYNVLNYCIVIILIESPEYERYTFSGYPTPLEVLKQSFQWSKDKIVLSFTTKIVEFPSPLITEFICNIPHSRP